jgi:hypothetical protein
LRLAELYALYSAYDLESWAAARDPTYRRLLPSPLARGVDGPRLLDAALALGFDGVYVGADAVYRLDSGFLLLRAEDLAPATREDRARPLRLTLADGYAVGGGD